MLQVRASRAVVMRLQAGHVLLFNFLEKTALRCNIEIIRFLSLLDDWKTEAEIAGALPGISASSIRRELDKLVALHAVVARNSSYAALEERYLREWEWGALSGLLHFALKDNPCLTGDEAVRLQLARACHDPSPQLAYTHEEADASSEIIALPRQPEAADLLRLMARRRTNRTSASPEISLPQLSDCLFAGLGITAEVVTETGRLPLAMTPSGGARNPFEAYIYARNVPPLQPGFYHYSAAQHSLRNLRHPDRPPPSALLGGQTWADAMPCLIFLVAHFERTMWKYGDNNGYRVVLIEAGHIAQNIMLAATAHGLTACPTAALAHSHLHACIRLEGLSRSALYALTLSVPGRYDAEVIPLTPANGLPHELQRLPMTSANCPMAATPFGDRP